MSVANVERAIMSGHNQNTQQANGRVRILEVLCPHKGGQEVLTP